MRVIGAWVGAVLLVCACAPLDDAFQETGQGGLTGCLQAPDGQVEGVTVWVRGRPERRQTDSNGCFNFDALPVGQVQVQAWRDPQTTWAQTGFVLARRVRQLTDLIAQPGRRVRGRLFLADRGAPPVMEVEVPDTPIWSWTRADHTFELVVPPGGCQALRLSAMNMEDLTIEGCPGSEVLVEVSPSTAPEPMVYLKLAPMPMAVTQVEAVLDGTTVYLPGGQSCDDVMKPCGGQFGPGQRDTLQIFDFRTGSWRMGPELPAPRSGASASIRDGRLLVAGGWRSIRYRLSPQFSIQQCRDRAYVEPDGPCALNADGEPVPGSCYLCFEDRVDELDLQSGRWLTAEDGVAQLPKARAWHASAQTLDGVYVVGGIKHRDGPDERGYLNDLAVHDDGEWSQAGFELPWGADQLAACASGRRIYALGGAAFSGTESLPAPCFRRLHIYNPSSGRWIQGAPVPYRRAYDDCVVIGNFLYVPGRTQSAPHPAHNLLRYDIAADRWDVLDGAPNVSKPAAVTTPHGMLLLGGGGFYTAQHADVMIAVAERFVDVAKRRYGAEDVEPYVRHLPPIIEDMPIVPVACDQAD